jgi:hypothetical protein
MPLDLGASPVTGMHVSIVYKLRQTLGLDKPGIPVKVVEPYQMLGEIGSDLIDYLGIDVVGLWPAQTIFGFKNEGWKEWKTFDGTPVLIPSGFNTDIEPNGELLLYPEGDKSVPASGRMPKGGWFFDSIIRQQPIDDDILNIEDNLEEFGPISNNDLNYFAAEAHRLYTQTDKAILAVFGGTAFGDIALVPAPWLKNPKGIRDIEEWYVSTAIRRDFVYNIFDRQCQIALSNFQKLYQAIGNKITAVYITGTDFGTQNGPFISPQMYRDLYQPFHKLVNTWIHKNTRWKTFMHSCGSIMPLIPDFIDAGFDILNPVQCSAVNMDPAELKKRFGDQISFWGGGIDTQKTLAFGTADQVREETKQRMEIFGKNGGFIFCAVHNIQAMTPVENVIAMCKTINQVRGYSKTL